MISDNATETDQLEFCKIRQYLELMLSTHPSLGDGAEITARRQVARDAAVRSLLLFDDIEAQIREIPDENCRRELGLSIAYFAMELIAASPVTRLAAEDREIYTEFRRTLQTVSLNSSRRRKRASQDTVLAEEIARRELSPKGVSKTVRSIRAAVLRTLGASDVTNGEGAVREAWPSTSVVRRQVMNALKARG